MTNKIITLVLSSVAVLVMSGCAAKGPQFNGFNEPLEGQSNVYVYRTSSLGAGVTPDIHATNSTTNNDKVIGSIKPNGYIMTTVTPSMYKFWAKTEAQNEVDLQIEPNKTYCIKHYISMGLLVGHPQFEIVDIEKCAEEIKETKLSLQD